MPKAYYFDNIKLNPNSPNLQCRYYSGMKKCSVPVQHFIGGKSGYYDSLVITLGNGKGENWWCILFPPLCMIDEKTSEVEYKSIVMEILNKYLKNETS